MNKPPISDSRALSEVAALLAEVDAAAARVARIELLDLDCERRMGELKLAQAEHEADRPGKSVSPSLSDLVQTLAADPSAANSAEWNKTADAAHSGSSKARAASARDLEAWEAKADILAAAEQRIAEEAAPLTSDLAAAKAAHEVAWENFIRSARLAMVDELERQFPALLNAVLGPIQALEHARKVYEPVHIGSGARKVLHSDSKLFITEPDPSQSFGGKSYTTLYPIAASALSGQMEAFSQAVRTVGGRSSSIG